MIFDANPPSTGQFALNGIWENALAFRVDSPPSIDELREYLAGGRELALELLAGSSFFGVRDKLDKLWPELCDTRLVNDFN